MAESTKQEMQTETLKNRNLAQGRNKTPNTGLKYSDITNRTGTKIKNLNWTATSQDLFLPQWTVQKLVLKDYFYNNQ